MHYIKNKYNILYNNLLKSQFMKELLLFFVLILIFIILMFIGNIQLNFDNLFLWKILSNKISLLIILWIAIFIFWKMIIDSFEKEEK